MTTLPLSGIRVLDLSTVLAAPVSTTMLGDFGAEVVKVEDPVQGDFTRGRAEQVGGRSLQWVQEGRNKKSVTLDLRKPQARELLRRLIPEFDVVVTNYRPPTLQKWGLDPESMRVLHPGGVFVYMTGYGLTGPYRDRGSFDRIASAFSGLTYVSGEPENPPVRTGYSVIDFMSAYLAAFATVTALFERDRNGGEGQVIDLALYEAAFRASEDALLDFAKNGVVRERLGNRNPHIVPATDFVASDDRRVSLHAGTDTLFRRLCEAMEQPELADDLRFATRTVRADNQDALYEIVGAWVGRQTADDATKYLNDCGIPASPVMNIADIAADPHYRDRGTIRTVEDAEHGEIPMAAPIPHLSRTPGDIRSLGPSLGGHTDEILRDLLDLSADEIENLRESRAI